MGRKVIAVVVAVVIVMAVVAVAVGVSEVDAEDFSLRLVVARCWSERGQRAFVREVQRAVRAECERRRAVQPTEHGRRVETVARERRWVPWLDTVFAPLPPQNLLTRNARRA